MMMAGTTVTNPAAGVMATSPATAPDAVPKIVGLPFLSHSITAQLRPPAAAAVFVTTNAFTARPFAARALPALNPNHPNHKSAVPRTTNGRLCGEGTLL